jgi:hypothetical protein
MSVIAIGFENTIVNINNNNQPYTNAIETINYWYSQNHKIIIWTTKYTNTDIKNIKNILKENNINYDTINKNVYNTAAYSKIIADYYIDDKIITFQNNWIDLKYIFGSPKVIAIDFDNTIFDCNNWPIVGSAKTDAVESINYLYDQGHTIIIWSSRSDIKSIRYAKKALLNVGIKYHKFNKNISTRFSYPKIDADYYINDKGIEFNDNWLDIKNTLTFNKNNVIVLMLDGIRYTESFGDSGYTYIPNLGNNLKLLGTLFTNFYNKGTTLTINSHASLITGTLQNQLDNLGNSRPNKPTLFEYYRKQYNLNQDSCYVIAGKDKLNVITYSTDLNYGLNYRASQILSNPNFDDNQTYNDLNTVLNSSNPPSLIVVNFAEVDGTAHNATNENLTPYTDKILQIDTIVYNIYNLIQTIDFYKDNTTIIITNDHGRHTYDISSHGDDCEGCQHIMLLMIGPNIPKNIVNNNRYTQIDIVSTIGAILNIDTTLSDGNVIKKAFIND